MTTAQHIIEPVAPFSFRRPALGFALLGAFTVFLMIINIGMGSVSFSPEQIWQVLLQPDAGSTMSAIIWKIRIPRAIAAVLDRYQHPFLALNQRCTVGSGLFYAIFLGLRPPR